MKTMRIIMLMMTVRIIMLMMTMRMIMLNVKGDYTKKECVKSYIKTEKRKTRPSVN